MHEEEIKDSLSCGMSVSNQPACCHMSDDQEQVKPWRETFPMRLAGRPPGLPGAGGTLLWQEGSEELGGEGGGTREAEHGAGAVSTHPKENGPPRGFLSTAPA